MSVEISTAKSVVHFSGPYQVLRGSREREIDVFLALLTSPIDAYPQSHSTKDPQHISTYQS